MRKMKRSDIPVLIIAGVILIGVLAGIVTMICGALEKKKLEPSADYYGLTVLEAMYLECDARGLSITDEELAALEAQALEDQRQYALTGEHVSYDDLLEELKFDFLFERLRLALPLEDNITDAQVQEWYDVRLAALNNAFQEEPGIFKSQQDLFDKHGGVPPLTAPEGYIYVRHILVADLATAQEVLDKLEAGEDFSALLSQYGTDPGMETEPFASLGYLVGPYPSKVDYLPEFKEAALTLTEVGQYSGIVETESGFHILRLESKLPGGTKPLSQVYDAIHAMLLKADQSEQLTALLKGWVS